MDEKAEIAPEKYFYACDGTVIKSLEELFTEMQDMEPHVFEHHVNDERNDFHNWINDVFQDRFLARNVKNVQDKEEMLRHIFVSFFR